MRAYQRLMNYVKVHTTSSEKTGTHPSFVGEFDLAKILVEELKDLGLDDAYVDEHCYVYAHLPATEGRESMTRLGFISHMDTSDEASGLNVQPILHEHYDGADVALGNSGRVLSPKQFPFLKSMVGETLITSDGTTLLGADDKAGISEIMTALETIQTEQLPHGPLSICFTPDEEIGEGTECFDLEAFGAEYAYTVDGGDSNCLEYENFNAASARVLIHGTSVHPGDAKDVMVNASNVAIAFHNMLPEDMRPEHTEGRDGFFHLIEMSGRVSESSLQYIIRDHDRAKFEEKKQLMQEIADQLNQKYGAGTVKLTLKDQYYNMLEKILPHMHLIENARAAIEEAGMVCEEVPIRGGTDGAMLSYKGLPCPNLGTGGFNFHGEYECTTVERMDRAVDVVLGIVRRYVER